MVPGHLFPLQYLQTQKSFLTRNPKTFPVHLSTANKETFSHYSTAKLENLFHYNTPNLKTFSHYSTKNPETFSQSGAETLSYYLFVLANTLRCTMDLVSQASLVFFPASGRRERRETEQGCKRVNDENPTTTTTTIIA